MRGRRWAHVALVLVVITGCFITWWLRRPRENQPPRPANRAVRLDVDAFAASQRETLQRAKKIAARIKTGSKAALAVTRSTGNGRWPQQGRGPVPNLGKNLLTPCVLGPGELCATLADLIESCDAGDADDCLAVGQFLADTPPRPLMAIAFFSQACHIGDPAGCERLDQLKPPSTIPCDQDAFACEWRAYRSHDEGLLDQACSLGAADACVAMAEATKQDIARSRAYIEAACQLGNPMTCAELGRRLSPDCIANEDRVCYPADPAQATAALAMACSSGWDDACP